MRKILLICLATGCLFSQDCCPSWKEPTLNAGYNLPANIDTCGSWDLWADASFLYWMPIEENIDPSAVINSESSVILPLPSVPVSSNFTILNMDYKFKPGFQVAIGFNSNYDQWDLEAEYTRFHPHQKKFASQKVFSPLLLDPGNLAFLYFLQDQTVGTPITALPGSVNADWHLNMDFLDLNLGRWFYVGQKLTFHPYCAARGVRIRQTLDVHYVNNYSVTSVGGVTSVVPFDSEANFQSESWGVGPRVGLDSHWNFGPGFRFFTNGAADILFTRFYNCRFRGILFLPSVSIHSENIVSHNTINTLRSHFDLQMGLGWGKYFKDRRWHIDLECGYGFQVFFDQNMFRHLTTAFVIPVGTSRYDNLAMTSNEPNGNLYIHGLTAKAKVDF